MKPEPSKKILIVDDEAHIRLLIQQTLEDLEDEGIEILSADNGTDAIQLAKQAAPQLIFLDVMMPNMDGLQVCQAIRQEPGDEGSLCGNPDCQRAVLRPPEKPGSRSKPLYHQTIRSRPAARARQFGLV